ncbi:MAG: hypothetical protein R3C10_25775 [Pirellulales bacterium]
MIEELTPHGITFRQMQVMAWLMLEGELSQNELASRMIIEPPTLVGVLTAWSVPAGSHGIRVHRIDDAK